MSCGTACSGRFRSCFTIVSQRWNGVATSGAENAHTECARQLDGQQ